MGTPSLVQTNRAFHRLLVGGVGVASGRAIDELEVYAAVPEPSAAAVLMLAGLGLLRRRRA